MVPRWTLTVAFALVAVAFLVIISGCAAVPAPAYVGDEVELYEPLPTPEPWERQLYNLKRTSA